MLDKILKDSKKFIVVCDIDGVLLETTKGAVNEFNQTYKTNYLVEDIFDHNAVHKKELFVIDGVDQFWRFQQLIEKHQPSKGAVKTIKRLAAQYTVVTLTSRSYDMFGDSTKEIIGKIFGNNVSKKLFTTTKNSGTNGRRNKGEMIVEFSGNVLIDDSVKHCQDCLDHGVPAILFKQPYNVNGHNYPSELTANNWEKIEEIISKIAKNKIDIKRIK